MISRIKPLPHRGRWVAGLVVLFLTYLFLKSLITNKNIQWHIVGEYLFASIILKGVAVTIFLTILAMLIGLIGGVVIAVMRISTNPILNTVSYVFIWFFRGTPVLVQIIFWGYLGALYTNIAIWIPFTDIQIIGWPTNSIMTPFLAAVLALGLNEAAYSAEIIRGGVSAIDQGQSEAAYSLGMNSKLTFNRIILPQAMRIIVPSMSNEVITMLKTTALVSVIGGTDLMTMVQRIYSQQYTVIPLLVVGTIWYLVLTTILAIPQSWLENHFGQSSAHAYKRISPMQRVIGFSIKNKPGKD
jgi:polar amino acid transport system permease protein